MKKEIFKERRSKLERILIDVSDFKVNQATIDFSFYYVGGTFNLWVDDEPIIKQVIKITRNQFLNLECVFVKTIELWAKWKLKKITLKNGEY